MKRTYFFFPLSSFFLPLSSFIRPFLFFSSYSFSVTSSSSISLLLILFLCYLFAHPSPLHLLSISPLLTLHHYGLKLYEIEANKDFFLMSLGAGKWANEWANERCAACEQSKQCGASEWVSGTRKRASRQASGPVLLSRFFVILDHSALGITSVVFIFPQSLLLSHCKRDHPSPSPSLSPDTAQGARKNIIGCEVDEWLETHNFSSQMPKLPAHVSLYVGFYVSHFVNCKVTPYVNTYLSVLSIPTDVLLSLHQFPCYSRLPLNKFFTSFCMSVFLSVTTYKPRQPLHHSIRQPWYSFYKI